ncbi:MAG TPA: L-threonylcarbamoyladenylate synthase [Dehalococcoidia bacterium]|nr:L-threonylcarbamoyladenylate synthase [Dehalococcoidia bacterium]
MERKIHQAIETLKNGGIVAFPTDTVYGLGANASSHGAILRIYEAKRRPRHLALPLLLADVSQIPSVARDMPEIAWLLAKHFLPGGLTLVLYKSPSVSSLITGGSEKIAVRVPAHPIPIALLEGLDAPITGTSANLTGKPSPLTTQEVHNQLGDMVDLIIDGECPGGVVSTVIDITTDPIRILREGAISSEEISRVCEATVKEG